MNRPAMPVSTPAPASAPVLQNHQNQNQTENNTTKLEENAGGAKHIDPKLIEMITSEVRISQSIPSIRCI